MSPFLTELSKDYVGEEYILDTDDLLVQLKGIGPQQGGRRLFTLDVEALYPSIRKDLALEALDHALRTLRRGNKTGVAVRRFVECILNESFITFGGAVYTSIEGIPTGNCVSRQIADIFLHWLLFIKCPGLIPPEAYLWRRFIDDIFGIWKGTERQLLSFITRLNEATTDYGIRFGDQQFGSSVNFLDVTVSVEEGELEYKLYRKPTDARNYLRTDSFHPRHVFRSVVFSQMLRVIKRNSREETRIKDLDDLRVDLLRSGHLEEDLNTLQPRAFERLRAEWEPPSPSRPDSTQLIFATDYFEGANELRVFLKGLEEDIVAVAGNVRVVLALRKRQTIGNVVVRNRRLSESSIDSDEQEHEDNEFSQKCGGRGCKTCPLLATSPSMSINGKRLRLSARLNCKSKNVIYVAQCNLCSNQRGNRKEDTYVGQTMQPFHRRVNGHRSKFTEAEHQGSALAQHCWEKHRDSMDLSFFTLGIVRQVNPMGLDRAESKVIDLYRTKLFGLNRILVVR